MGNYTSFAQMGASSWYSRRNRGGQSKAALASHVPPTVDSKLQCPRCEQCFPFDGTCPTCEIALVDRTEVLVVPKNAENEKPLLVGSPFAFATGVVALLAPALYLLIRTLEGGRSPVELNALLFLAGAAGLGAVYHLVRRYLRTRSGQKTVAARRDADARVAVSSTAVLPAEADDLVKVRGKLRLAVENDELRAWVEDDEGIAMLPVSANLRVANPETLVELDEIAGDREVEVVGVGRRVASGGTSYRAAEQTFVFDEGSVVDVWV